MNITDKQKNIGMWCSVLSTEAHGACEWRTCACPCHQPIDRNDVGAQPRPHSYPREKWQFLGSTKRADTLRRNERRHRQGLEHDRRVVALGALGAGLGVAVPGGDDDLVDLESDPSDS